MFENKINIGTYFKKGTKFLIPEFQRGYKWGVKPKDGKSSVEFFCDSLIESYMYRREIEYFIEAVTVVQEKDDGTITLVDGQQRTTTLYLIFVVLNEFDFLQGIELKYSIREDSHNFLENLCNKENHKIVDEDIQDIVYFKKALENIENKLKKIKGELDLFSKFIKDKVYLLFNTIPADKAVNTFIALNGLKAIIKNEELIKSDFLIKSSNDIAEIDIDSNEDIKFTNEWRANESRGRLARNWDKWLYWWSQKEVKEFYGIDNYQHPLHYLLVTFWNRNKEEKDSEFSFDNFKNKFIDTSGNAKRNFEKIRKQQKAFEDVYLNEKTYNLLGLSLATAIKKEEIILFFIKNLRNELELIRFTKWALLECTIDEILKNDKKIFEERKFTLKTRLSARDLYEGEGKKQAYLQLLRMNIDEMHNRKFNFEIFKTKSLEHICPQNPKDDLDFLNSKKDIDETSDGINSIGNLVLLNGSANSSLSNNPLIIKKQLLFDKIKNGFLLPHTLKVFSKSFSASNTISLFDTEKYWVAENVIKNKQYFFEQFDNFYN